VLDITKTKGAEFEVISIETGEKSVGVMGDADVVVRRMD
jgi:hypothetical protein